MRTHLLFLAAALVAASPVPVLGQRCDTLRLSIEDAVTRMLRSSDEARAAWQLVESADAQVMAARAAGLPQLRLSSSYQQVLKNARAEMVSQMALPPASSLRPAMKSSPCRPSATARS